MSDAPQSGKRPVPIHFKSREEFESRPNYLPAVRCTSDGLDYIAGKYGFSADKKLQCGLNGCNSWHQHGFVIATKSGTETHCGQDCGRREFHVSWDEIHAEFERQAKADVRKQLVSKLLEDRNELLKRALSMQSEIAGACSKVRAIYDELRKEPLLAKEFENALANDGRILTELEVDARVAQAFGQRGRNANLTTVGRILGRVAPAKYRSIAATFERSVVQPLVDLGEKSVDTMSDERIEQSVRTIEALRLELGVADQFLTSSRQFLSPKNFAEIEKLKLVLPSRARTSRLDRIFGRLPAFFNA